MLAVPFYAAAVKETRQKAVADLAMSHKVTDSFKKLQAEPDASALECELKKLPAYLDALRSSTCKSLQAAFLEACEGVCARLHNLPEPSLEAMNELHKLNSVVSEAQSLKLLPASEVTRMAARITVMLDKWRGHAAAMHVNGFFNILSDEEQSTEQKVAAVIPVLGKFTTHLENLTWDEDAIESGCAAFEKLRELHCHMCTEVTQKPDSLSSASQCLAGLAKLAKKLDAVQGTTTDGWQSEAEVSNFLVQMMSAYVECPSAADMKNFNPVVELMSARSRLDGIHVPDHISALVKALLTEVDAKVESIRDARTKALQSSFDTEIKSLRKTMKLGDGSAVENIVWWKDVPADASLQQLLKHAQKTILGEGFAQKIATQYRSAMEARSKSK